MAIMRIRKRYTFIFAGFTILALSYLHVVDVGFLLQGEFASPMLKAKCLQSLQERHRLTITTLTKNSASYIKEWIEYHLLVGVDHFFILDNESIDNVYSVLQPYIEQNLITYIPWRDSYYLDAQLQATLNTQQKGIVYALSLYGCKSQWTALIDDDEFLLPKGNTTVKDVLKFYTDYGGLAVGWAWFGSNGHSSKPDAMVIESFTKRRRELDVIYKTIIQPKYFKRLKTIHFPVFHQNYSLVTENYEVLSPITEHVKKLAYTLNHPTSDIIQVKLSADCKLVKCVIGRIYYTLLNTEILGYTYG